ncbi:DegV family protein [Ligilactobacillus saerimneri]|uniref:DegV family protein n=2 Tax=Ligilactobacillus saerimneri TaxID=228229 RepID=M5J5R6_9LACO|nr:DegV family protein [Ligilactobacillus saerimneri]EKW98515.1 DegV family protein [Ligilactobacillus saerimneri 30a]KRL74470.1 EDD domain protein, DegV family [Ligilactobacillus saerimneri DSM 16049]MBU5309140.1 DegV family protein [Ligilactobacillus saerimneri]MCZ0891766.1 DegV family protein [Ligilactobacillus saerimneri]MDI9205772.1 DegV family protein [Ligilactobacillus saerimneri]
MKIAVVTDSTSYLPEELIQKYDIRVVPIPFILNEKTYEEGVDITTEEFYSLLAQSPELPSTSQPPLGEMISLYEDLRDEGYEAVISIHLAATISGLVGNLQNIASQIEGIKVIPYDSGITVRLMGELAVAAAQDAAKGMDIDSIVAHLDELRSTVDEYFLVDDLQNLVKGGRLSNASAFIGTMLKIKPILTFDDDTNKIVAFDKVRSMKRAKKRVESLFIEQLEKTDYPVHLFVIHANNEKAANEWRDSLQEQFPNLRISVTYFGPVIGCHLGEKAMALGWMRDIEE